MNKIHKPLTLEQAEKLANSQRELTVTITVNFEDLLKGIDAFNEMVDEKVGVVLEGAGFKIIGHTTPQDQGAGSIELQVSGTISEDRL